MVILFCWCSASTIAKPNNTVVEITEERAILRTGPGEDFDRIVNLPKGTRYNIIEQKNEWGLIKLSSNFSGWIKIDSFKNSVSQLSHPLLLGIKMKALNENETVVTCNLSESGAVIARQWLNPAVLFLELHGASGHIHEINFDPDDRVVRYLSVMQTAPDVVTLKIDLESWHLAGYRWEFKDNVLQIRLRKLNITRNASLQGLTVAVDPGHGGKDAGAVGKDGYKEKDANLAISFLLKKRLEDAGAKVIMTRETDMEVIELQNKKVKEKDITVEELASRAAFAKEKGAHLFISVHCNAKGIIAEGRVARGSYIYYYHPGSFSYASILAKELASSIGEEKFGVNFRSFHVTRENTFMPSVLAEVAFISNPEEEEKLKTQEFKAKIADGLFNGIVRYCKEGHGHE